MTTRVVLQESGSTSKKRLPSNTHPDMIRGSRYVKFNVKFRCIFCDQMNKITNQHLQHGSRAVRSYFFGAIARDYAPGRVIKHGLHGVGRDLCPLLRKNGKGGDLVASPSFKHQRNGTLAPSCAEFVNASLLYVLWCTVVWWGATLELSATVKDGNFTLSR